MKRTKRQVRSGGKKTSKGYSPDSKKATPNKNTPNKDTGKSSPNTYGGGVRINKYLANAGVCSRREADKFVEAGVVSINGKVVTELGTKVKYGDVVKFNDETLVPEKKTYIF